MSDDLAEQDWMRAGDDSCWLFSQSEDSEEFKTFFKWDGDFAGRELEANDLKLLTEECALKHISSYHIIHNNVAEFSTFLQYFKKQEISDGLKELLKIDETIKNSPELFGELKEPPSIQKDGSIHFSFSADMDNETADFYGAKFVENFVEATQDLLKTGSVDLDILGSEESRTLESKHTIIRAHFVPTVLAFIREKPPTIQAVQSLIATENFQIEHRKGSCIFIIALTVCKAVVKFLVALYPLVIKIIALAKRAYREYTKMGTEERPDYEQEKDKDDEEPEIEIVQRRGNPSFSRVKTPPCTHIPIMVHPKTKEGKSERITHDPDSFVKPYFFGDGYYKCCNMKGVNAICTVNVIVQWCEICHHVADRSPGCTSICKKCNLPL